MPESVLQQLPKSCVSLKQELLNKRNVACSQDFLARKNPGESTAPTESARPLVNSNFQVLPLASTQLLLASPLPSRHHDPLLISSQTQMPCLACSRDPVNQMPHKQSRAPAVPAAAILHAPAPPIALSSCHLAGKTSAQSRSDRKML